MVLTDYSLKYSQEYSKNIHFRIKTTFLNYLSDMIMLKDEEIGTPRTFYFNKTQINKTLLVTPWHKLTDLGGMPRR